MSAPTKLVVDAVGKVFGEGDDEFLAIDRIDLSIAANEFVSIVGTSGCGKSTLLNMVGGLTEPTFGDIRIDGKPVTGPGRDRGFVFQGYSLFEWKTVEGNIRFALEKSALSHAEKTDLVRHFIQSVGLSGFEKAFPRQLSGGMRQRVAIMRTLAFDPKVILLDEPFSALDFQTRLLLQADVTRIIAERGKSAILVTHDIGEAIAMADRVLVLSARPATVRALHVIDLPRVGRDPVALRTDAAFQAYFARIWADLEMPANVS